MSMNVGDYVVPKEAERISVREFLALACRAFKVSYQARGMAAVVVALVGFAFAFMPSGISLALRAFTDAVQGLYLGSTSFSAACALMVLLMLLYLAQQLYTAVRSYYTSADAERIMRYINERILRCVCTVKMRNIDGADDFAEKVAFSQGKAGLQVAASMQEVTLWLQNLVSFVALAVVLADVSAWVIPVILVTCLPSVVISYRQEGERYRLSRSQSREEAFGQMYFQDCTRFQCLQELKFLCIFPHIKERKWRRTVEKVVRESDALTFRHTVVSCLADLLRGSVYVGILAIVAWEVYENPSLGLGAFTLVISATSQLQNLTAQMFFGIAQFVAQAHYMKDFFALEDMEREGIPADGETSVREGVSAHGDARVSAEAPLRAEMPVREEAQASANMPPSENVPLSEEAPVREDAPAKNAPQSTHAKSKRSHCDQRRKVARASLLAIVKDSRVAQGKRVDKLAHAGSAYGESAMFDCVKCPSGGNAISSASARSIADKGDEDCTLREADGYGRVPLDAALSADVSDKDVAHVAVSPNVPNAAADIRFENVTFSYPESTTPALRDISVTIREGERVAIVGRNGSGKSTFVNLLCGLYDPQEGSVSIGGLEVSQNVAHARGLISGVFQDFGRYEDTIRFNVAISDISQLTVAGRDDLYGNECGKVHGKRIKRRDGENQSAEASEALLEAASGEDPLDGKQSVAADAEMMRLLEQVGAADFVRARPGGLDAVVGSYSEGGANLSGGQWQRLAIARAAWRKQARIMLLDEPTSALDPVAEASIYRNFADLVGDRTALFVSHRLGVSSIVDRVLVFDAGRIVEDGTPEELRVAGGLYAELYESQAQWYR